jgi:beta-lactamase regulating signal transducer with metallopeptidase domain
MSGLVLRSLLDASIRISVVAAAVGLILVALRIRTNDARHTAWTVVLFGMLLMPVLPSWVPVVDIPVPQSARRVVAPAGPVRLAFPAGPVVLEPIPSLKVSAAPEPTAETHSSELSLRHRLNWPVVALATYLLGVVVFLARFAIGWLAANRIARRSQPIAAAHQRLSLCDPGADWRGTLSMFRSRLCESTMVVTPVTLGVIAPAIILPATWRQWPNDALRAVLSHERAHVRRRDPLVNVLAHLNRCVFWFHPLAWWLTHTLATMAEHACDDVAVRAVGDARKYAEVLIDMAAVAHQSGGRISWQGAGIDGHLLGQRIDRVIRGDARQELSAVRTWSVATSCAAAIIVVVACRLQSAPLAPMRGVSKVAEHANFDGALPDADQRCTGVTALEARHQKDPEDLLALKRLLICDWARLSPEGVRSDETLTTRRRARIVWLIEHHPDADLAGSPEARLFPLGSGSLSDPIGHTRAMQLWLAHTKRADASAAVLRNAASFFEATDKPLAEALLLRTRAEHPQEPSTARLAQFYVFALAGHFVFTSARTPPRDVADAEPKGAFADAVRRKLAESSDDELLTAVGEHLLRAPHNGRIFDPPRLLALPVLRRAVEVNPRSVRARADLVHVLALDRDRRVSEGPGKVPPIAEYEAVSALPDAERFDALVVANSYPPGEIPAEWQEDSNLTDWFNVKRTRARQAAEDLLRLGRAIRDERQGTAIYLANMSLGSMALIDGDRKAAVRYLLAASRAPVSEELAYSRHITGWKLVRRLLEQGERESVIEFLERMAHISIVDHASLRECAAAIRRGDMPHFGPYWTAYYPQPPVLVGASR